MSSDVRYGIEIAYFTTGNPLAKVRDLGGAISGLEKPMQRASSTFISTFGGAITSVADSMMTTLSAATMTVGAVLGAGIGLAVKEGIKENASLESTTLGLAGLFAAAGHASDMNSGLTLAADTIAKMRKDAATLPGTFQDLSYIYKTAFQSGSNAGLGVDQMRALSAQVMSFATASGIDKHMAGREFAQLLDGRSGGHNVLGQRLMNLRGDSAKEYNALPAEKRIGQLNAALAKFEPLAKAYGSTFDAVSSTAVDNVKQTLTLATSGVFTSVKGALYNFNAWFDSNRSTIESYAVQAGHYLSRAFDWAVARTMHWGPLLVGFARQFGNVLAEGFERVAPWLQRVESAVDRFMSRPDAASDTVDAAKYAGLGLLGVRAATMLAPAAEGALGAAGIELGAALGPLAVGFAAVAGAVHVLIDSTSWFHDTAVRAGTGIMTSLGHTFEHVGNIAGRALPMLVSVADAMGTGLLMALENVAKSLEAVTGLADAWSGMLEKGYDWIRKSLGILNGGAPAFDTRGRPEFEPPSSRLASVALTGYDPSAPPHGKVHNHTTHIHGGINIRVEGSDDPTRVARKAVDIIKREIASPSARRSNPNAVQYR